MPGLFWIAMAVIGGGLLLLVLGGGDGTTLGMDSDSFASALYLGVWGVVLAAGLLASRIPMGHVARNLAVWLLIILVLVAGYQYRYELQDIGHRVTLGIVPGSPLSIGSAEDGLAVRLDKGPSGHFEARGSVNGAPIRLMIDTGATSTVLSSADAQRAGIDPSTLSFTLPVATANGVTQAARTTVEEIAIGQISRTRMPVLVAAPGTLGISLLGMNFMGTLSGFDVRGDVMILRD
jgi:aspartyl protease family protein